MPRRGDLTLDLSHLTFMGSEGIRLFIQLARDREGIGRLVLANPSPPVRRVLDVTGLGHILPNLKIDPAAAADPL
jgi:anti-anti-sigma factor